MGITNDIMPIMESLATDEHTRLHKQFTKDPWLSEVVEALTNGSMPDI